MQTLDPNQSTFLHDQLEAGESILWSGGTDVNSRMRKIVPVLLLTVPFLSVLCGFTLSASSLGMGVASALFWVILGAAIWFGQKAYLGGLIYVVTNRRAMIISTQVQKKIESYPPSKFTAFEIRNQKDSRGDMIFTHIVGTGRYRGKRYPHGFIAVENPGQVKGYLLELKRVVPARTNSYER